MVRLDLERYRQLFPEVCRVRFGRAYNFQALEKEFHHLGEGQKGRWLAARDVLKLFDPERTPFHSYWTRPAEKEIDRALSAQRLMLAPVTDGGRAIVSRLLDLFQSIGIASLVLRFARPADFALFGAPVAHLLQVRQPTLVDFYLEYCSELAEWGRHFQIKRAADVETALWTLHECTQGILGAPEAEAARRASDGDLWVQRRRAALVLGPLFKTHGPLGLARILVDIDANIAGKIAGEEYERLLKVAATSFLGWHNPSHKIKADVLIDELARREAITLEEKVTLSEIWRIRNQAVHPGQLPTPEQVEKMIDGIERICLPWSQKIAPSAKKNPRGG